ncbi:CYFA0S01e13146g1_1 [Cyberlindnera fabianii]|uniref:DASH complex subunit DAD1 n=1 Tax=Cyberlindnera fabianii TaxID=36022 RepID=A0A061AKD8_CYBFA|nr:CYFA0S01e13146g1_1 [Cyberlindnera fabianii]
MTTQKEAQPKPQLTYFEKQRDALISEIAISMESVLNNVNALNRSLEGAIAVGKEFDSVASLWANFYDGLAQQDQLRPQSEGDGDAEEDADEDAENDQENTPATQETEVNEDQMDVDAEAPSS